MNGKWQNACHRFAAIGGGGDYPDETYRYSLIHSQTEIPPDEADLLKITDGIVRFLASDDGQLATQLLAVAGKHVWIDCIQSDDQAFVYYLTSDGFWVDWFSAGIVQGSDDIGDVIPECGGESVTVREVVELALRDDVVTAEEVIPKLIAAIDAIADSAPEASVEPKSFLRQVK